jgi:hypothetical protein
MNDTPKNTRPRVAVEIPVDGQKNPLYTPQQISDYQAVLHRQVMINAHKAGNDPEKLAEAKRWMSMSAGGTFGKSALLNRIASGLWPFVVSPPVSMSYPWYSVVESDEPEELWLDAPSADELLKLGEKSSAWLRNNVKGLSNLFKIDQMVPVNQSLWKVVQVVGPEELHITWPGWEELGFVWRLAIDEVSATVSSQHIVPWHNPALKKITTLEQLILEQRWHVNKRIEEMRAAITPELAEEMLAKAKEKDGEISRFNQTSVTQNLQARIQEGKPSLPDEAETEDMVNQAVQRYLAPRSGSGSGWYSVAQDGTLVLHTWRIRRIAPVEVPESIYLDVNEIERAPD